MAIEKIIIHAGPHKTGTTSIQDTLSLKENRRLLSEKGMLYWTGWHQNNGFELRVVTASHQVLLNNPLYSSHGITGREPIEKAITQTKSSLLEATKNCDCDTLIISGEDISLMSYEELEKLKFFFLDLFGNIEFHIIFYIRNPINSIISAVQTVIIGFGMMERSIHTKDYKLIDGIYPLFAEAFGKNNVHIYKFEDALDSHHKNIVVHFLHILGLNNDAIQKFRLMRSNESHCHFLVELFRYFNEKVPIFTHCSENKTLNTERGKYNFETLFGLKGAKFDIPSQQKMKLARDLMNTFEWIRRELNVEYGDDLTIQHNGSESTGVLDSIIDLQYKWQDLTLPSKKLLLQFLRQSPDFGNTTPLILKLEYSIDMNEKFESLAREKGYKAPLLACVSSLNNFVQLFFDFGRGFSEQDSRRFAMPTNGVFEFKMVFNPEDNLSAFRFDPSCCCCLITIDNITINEIKDNCIFAVPHENIYYMSQKNVILFLEDDPKILIKPLDRKFITSISIKAHIEHDNALVELVKASRVVGGFEMKAK